MANRIVGVSLMLAAAVLLSAPPSIAESQASPATSSAENTHPAAENASSESIGEITVTARRRNEFLQDVPIAVSAISGDAATRIGMVNSEALVIATPSLEFNRQSAIGATPFLRGVGTARATTGGESPVAIYVDDVYVASPSANLFALNNIESVQVLKGPQGTLFGRNATGGVIQVSTKKPSFDPSLEAFLGYGSYNSREGGIYATTGVTDNVAVNIAASGRQQTEGYGRSTLTGNENQLGWDWDVRGELLWKLAESTTILLSVDHSDLETDIGANSTVFPGTTSLGGGTFAGPYNTQTAGLDWARISQSGASVKINHEASFANLVSISAYRYAGLAAAVDLDSSPQPFAYLDVKSPVRTFSQELQLVSKPGGTLTWIVGGYYFFSNSKYDPVVVSGFAVAPFDDARYTNTQKLNSFSGFGEAVYEVFSNTNLTAGVRYTRDSYKYINTGQFLETSGQPSVLVPGTVYTTQASFPKVTYRAILDHHFSSAILGYISYSRGFKSGGYNLSAPAHPNPIQPEVLDAAEAGIKTRFFNGAVTVNGSAYYYDYKNLGVSIINTGVEFTENAAAARIKGMDLDFTITPVRSLRVFGGIGLIDGKYTRFPNGPTFTQNPVFPFGNVVGSADLSGNTTAFSPRFTASVAPSYTLESPIGSFTMTASYYYNSGFFSDPSNRLRQPNYNLVNASLSWDSPTDRLGVRLWSNNLTDSRYYSYFALEAARTALNYSAPRTYGITLTTRF